MRGNIYTRQKCPVCSGALIHDEKRGGCFCKDHPQVGATGDFYLKFGRDINKRSQSYGELLRMLNGLRFKVDEQTFDARDYKADQPLAFVVKAEEYLKEKTHLKSFRDIRRYVMSAVAEFGDRNVKTLRRPDIKHWLKQMDVTDKTRANYLTQLHDFYRWLVEEEYIEERQLPRFPKIEFELAYRNFTTWDVQVKIMEKLFEQTWHLNPKIYFGIDLLRIHTNIRPGDLLRLTEADVNTEVGVLIFHRPTKTKNRRKTVRLLDEELDLAKEFKERWPATPTAPFFRHHDARTNAIKPGAPFGEKYLYKRWKDACRALGIEGLDLYGGTRHTSVTELAIRYGEEAAKDATEHETNKAFDRYCQMQGERAQKMAVSIRKAAEVRQFPRTTSAPPEKVPEKK